MDLNGEVQKNQHTNCRNALREGGTQLTSLWKQILDTLIYVRPSIQKQLDRRFLQKAYTSIGFSHHWWRF